MVSITKAHTPKTIMPRKEFRRFPNVTSLVRLRGKLGVTYTMYFCCGKHSLLSYAKTQGLMREFLTEGKTSPL